MDLAVHGAGCWCRCAGRRRVVEARARVSDAVQIAIIAGLAQAIPTMVVAVLGYRKLNGLHHEMNSMKDALVASAKIEGHAQGVKDEKANPTK